MTLSKQIDGWVSGFFFLFAPWQESVDGKTAARAQRRAVFTDAASAVYEKSIICLWHRNKQLPSNSPSAEHRKCYTNTFFCFLITGNALFISYSDRINTVRNWIYSCGFVTTGWYWRGPITLIKNKKTAHINQDVCFLAHHHINFL